MRISDAVLRHPATFAGSVRRAVLGTHLAHIRKVTMIRLSLASLAAATLGLALVPHVSNAAPVHDSPADATVTMSGTAYEFNRVHTMLGGAVIHLAEDPDVTTTVADDGTYALEVPDGTDITPYITKDGYATIYLQTFTTDGQDLRNVNFQTPTLTIRDLLQMFLSVPTNDEGYPAECAVVSTVSTKQVRGVTYDQFIGWGAHGVAGAQATITPEVGKRTYFNEHVLPDASVTETSEDGGVVWTEVPAGSYTLNASGAGSQWPAVHITCADGRIVNANPPWGLNQLATTVPTKVTASWKSGPDGTPSLARLTVGPVPKQVHPEGELEPAEVIDFRGVVTVSCTGKGCFAPKQTHGSMEKSVDLKALLGRSAGSLKPGRTLTVSLAVPGYNARVDSWKIGKRGTPTRTSTCIPLGWSAEQKSC